MILIDQASLQIPVINHLVSQTYFGMVGNGILLGDKYICGSLKSKVSLLRFCGTFESIVDGN